MLRIRINSLYSNVPITPSPLVTINFTIIRTNKHELSTTGGDGATLVASSSPAVVVHQNTTSKRTNLLLLPLQSTHHRGSVGNVDRREILPTRPRWRRRRRPKEKWWTYYSKDWLYDVSDEVTSCDCLILLCFSNFQTLLARRSRAVNLLYIICYC